MKLFEKEVFRTTNVAMCFSAMLTMVPSVTQAGDVVININTSSPTATEDAARGQSSRSQSGGRTWHGESKYSGPKRPVEYRDKPLVDFQFNCPTERKSLIEAMGVVYLLGDAECQSGCSITLYMQKPPETWKWVNTDISVPSNSHQFYNMTSHFECQHHEPVNITFGAGSFRGKGQVKSWGATLHVTVYENELMDLRGADTPKGAWNPSQDGPSQNLVRRQCDVHSGKQECCSAKKCGGHVLSNRDAHNCKVKSHGKSWHNAAGDCHNL
jgi:hypothetical protein